MSVAEDWSRPPPRRGPDPRWYVKSVNDVKPDVNGNVDVRPGLGGPGSGGGYDMDATKVAENPPADAVIWFPANMADITVSADPADRQVMLAATEGWEETAVMEPSVWYADGQWHMIYCGGWNTAQGLGHATAPHPLGDWTKDPANPVLGMGKGGEPDSAGRPFAFLDLDGTLYVYYVNAGGTGDTDLYVATGDPHSLRRVGAVLSPPSGASAMANVAVYNDGTTYHMIFEAAATSGDQWKLGYATASSPLGPFTVDTFPLPTLQVGAGVGVCSGPHLSRQDDGTWTLLYHASTTSSTLPNDIYRATSTDLVTWTKEAGPFISRVVDPPEADQVADVHYHVTDFGGFMFWSAMDNTAETGSIMGSQVAGVGQAQWFDGETWRPLGDVSQAELDAVQAEVDALEATVAALDIPATAGDLTTAYMPLTTVVAGAPELVWDADDSLIPTEVPL